MANILVTGSNGQMGQELQFLANQFPNHYVFTDVADLDITKAERVNAFFEKNHFDYCINCAAYTAVDKAETDIELATSINVKGVKNLALACLNNNTFLIQLSTDYVYHNSQNTPFKEGDTTNPQGVYARTKLEGDLIALDINNTTMIIRTSWVYSSYAHNFVKTMLRLGENRNQLSVVFDQIGTPTYARDLAKILLQIIQQIENGTTKRTNCRGVFHCSNEGVTSWYDFAQAIFSNSNIKCTLNPIETVDYPTPAKRPPFSVLNKAKIKETFNIKIPHWQDGLQRCLKAIEQES